MDGADKSFLTKQLKTPSISISQFIRSEYQRKSKLLSIKVKDLYNLYTDLNIEKKEPKIYLAHFNWYIITNQDKSIYYYVASRNHLLNHTFYDLIFPIVDR